MNWEQVGEFVDAWAVQRGLPRDMKGLTLTLVDFETDEDCSFFYPDRTQLAQKAFTSALAKFARARRARTEHATITPAHYQVWLVAERLQDSVENRAVFIESRYKILSLR